jgi:hypothetical protein
MARRLQSLAVMPCSQIRHPLVGALAGALFAACAPRYVLSPAARTVDVLDPGDPLPTECVALGHVIADDRTHLDDIEARSIGQRTSEATAGLRNDAAKLGANVIKLEPASVTARPDIPGRPNFDLRMQGTAYMCQAAPRAAR